MKKPGVKFLNTILALGMLCLFVGFLLTVSFFSNGQKLALSLFPVLLSLAGLAFLYTYIAFSQTAFKLFVALECILNGYFFIIATQPVFPLTLSKCWPFVVIFTGISYMSAGKRKYKKWTFIYDFPGLVLIGFGVLLLLFSFNVIKIPFATIAAFSLPVLFFVSGILLMVLFFKRKALLQILPESVSEEFSDSKILDDSQDIDSADSEE